MVAGIKQGERPHVGLLSSFHRKGQGVIVGFEHDEKPSGDLLSLTGKVEMWSLWSIRVKPRMGLLLSTEKAKLWSLRSKLERGVKPGVGLLLLSFSGLGVVSGTKSGCTVPGSLETARQGRRKSGVEGK